MLSKEQIEGFSDDITALFILPDGEYGYGYTYFVGRDEEEPYRSLCAQSRFTKEAMLNPEDFDEAMELSKQYIGDHANVLDALNNVLDFWLIPKEKIKFDPSLTLADAIRVGREENYDVVIF